MRGVISLLAAMLFIYLVNGDTYMHNPRGSNNRLNERSANRRNANRLFDSQNNNRGGYNTGDKTDQAFSNENGIYYMKYFQSAVIGKTYLPIEWTNQHGCGGDDSRDPHKLNCNLVLQYMCQLQPESVTSEFVLSSDKDTYGDVIRDGRETGTQNYQAPTTLDESAAAFMNRRNQLSLNRGLHEPFSYYDDCYVRERNSGLFLADQRLNRGRMRSLGYFGARFTRQNPNANRRGYECPEERDYYPYWHPTPWKDIAVLVSDVIRCPWYQNQSFNVQPRYLCREKYADNSVRPKSRWNNETACNENGGSWTVYYNYLEFDDARTTQSACEADNNAEVTRKWARAFPDLTLRCLVLLREPDCVQAGWTRVNHLGNSRSGFPLNYTWELPYFMDGQERRCVLRIRYNISTDDYDPVNTDASFNENTVRRIRSPVTQNPYIDVGSLTNGPLRLAINTAQFGRTFQDRSHVFILRPRPPQNEVTNPSVQIDDLNIYNVNVRGKRGNIVQVYPAVEYDFIPNRLSITTNDVIHFQWTGSNTHNNGNPAGDGQAGDAGEGRGGTDRHNIVEIASAAMNYPVPFENSTLFNAEVIWYDSSRFGEIVLTGDDKVKNLALLLSSTGYYECFTGCSTNSVQNKNQLNNLLNNAYASFNGPLLRFTAGSYHYISSRNNNFTNRSQKGLLVVRAAS